MYEPSQIGDLSLEYVKIKSHRRRVRLGGATAGYWIFCRIFQDYWQRVCLTMVDKNIVIAVSMKQNGVLTMSSGLACHPSPSSEKILSVRCGKVVMCSCISSKYCPRTQYVCMSLFCKDFEISIACMDFLKCVET